MIHRSLIVVLALAAASTAQESGKNSVVGITARRTVTFNMRGQEMSRPMNVRQLGVVIGKNLVLTPSLGDEPENVRVHLIKATDPLDADVVDAGQRFTVLKVEGLDREPTPFASSWTPKVGEEIIWVGLLSAPGGRWVSIAKLSKVHALVDDTGSATPLIYSDPPFNGPVLTNGALIFNQSGKAVGMVGLQAQASGGRRGMRMRSGIPVVRPVSEFAHYLGGDIKPRGILGVTVEPLNEKVAEALGLKGIQGLLVTQVTPGSGAAEAGIEAQQVITRVADQPTSSVATLQKALRGLKAGDAVNVQVVRITEQGPAPATVKVKLGARESDDGERLRAKRFGFVAEPIPATVRRDQGLDAELKGLHVRRVTPGSPAALARPSPLRRGDIILRVGESDVGDLEGLKAALKRAPNGTAVTLFVRKGTATRFVEIKPEKEDPGR